MFSQAELLTERQFVQEARKRGVQLDRGKLEQLHRRRLLVPFLHVHRERTGAAIQVERPDRIGGWEVRFAASEGRLRDPAQHPFRRWARRTDSNRYSTFQLIALTTLKPIVDAMPGKLVDRELVWDQPPVEAYLIGYGEHYRALAIVAEILAPRYLPRVRRTIRHGGQQFGEINALVNDHDPRTEEEALSTDPEALLTEAEMLLFEAGRIDPLGSWSRLVRIGNPQRWDDLRFDALTAHEKRIVAEMLVMHIEDRAELGRALPLQPLTGYLHQPRHDRLTVDHDERSEALLDFQLVDRPALVIAVEGDTEALIVPRVLQLFGIDETSGLIQVVNLKSVDGDVRLLARAVAIPRLAATEHGPRLLSAATALIVAVDPEKKYRTPSQQADKCRDMVNEVFNSLGHEFRTDGVRRALQYCIRVRTWGTHSFEFAHYSIHELATAIRRLGGVHATPLAEIKAELEQKYESNSDLAAIWKGWPVALSKVKLADELWPHLRKRLVSGQGRPAPVKAVIEEAVQLAYDARRTRVFEGPDG